MFDSGRIVSTVEILDVAMNPRGENAKVILKKKSHFDN